MNSAELAGSKTIVSGIFPGFLLPVACFGALGQVVRLLIRQKKNRRKRSGFQRFSLVQNGGRSRTRIYDLHDVKVHKCVIYQCVAKVLRKFSVIPVFIWLHGGACFLL